MRTVGPYDPIQWIVFMSNTNEHFYEHYESASFHTVIHLRFISYNFILFSLFISFFIFYGAKKVKVKVSNNIL